MQFSSSKRKHNPKSYVIMHQNSQVWPPNAFTAQTKTSSCFLKRISPTHFRIHPPFHWFRLSFLSSAGGPSKRVRGLCFRGWPSGCCCVFRILFGEWLSMKIWECFWWWFLGVLWLGITIQHHFFMRVILEFGHGNGLIFSSWMVFGMTI